MTNQTTAPIIATARFPLSIRFFLALLLSTSLSFPVFAASNALQKIEAIPLSGGQVQISFLHATAATMPTVFSTDNPARVVLDFDNTAMELADKKQSIDIGLVESVSVISAQRRTRAVINLTESAKYQTVQNGNAIVLTIGATQRAIPKPFPQQQSITTEPTASGPRITDIDFRRGENGQGQIVIGLSQPDLTIDTEDKKGAITVNLINARLPDSLAKEFNVVDFATPVTTFVTSARRNNTRLDISVRGDYSSLAYQIGNVYTVEVAPVKESEQAALSKKVFTGEKLSLNFQNIEVRSVLQILADFTGKNLVASDAVGGALTLRLKNVPWDQALSIILSAKGLGMREDGNVMRIAPIEELAAQERLELESKQQISELAPLHTEFIEVNYAKASDLVTLLKGPETNMLTERGNITLDERTNTILINDTAAKISEIKKLIARLDIPVRQVLIEARIVNAGTDFSKKLGVRFGYTHFDRFGNTNSNAASTGNLNGTTQILNGEEVEGNNRWGVNLPASSVNGFPASSVALAIAKIGKFKLLELELSALEAEGAGEILSNPRVVTSDQKEALIEQGSEVPYTTASSSGATTVEFKKAVLSLKVTPQITPDGHIIMDLRVNKDAIGPEFGGVPTIDTQEVETQVLVENGETIVIGGIYEQNKASSVTRVPFLGELPFIGRLFQTRTKTDDKAELLIFVTPKILDNGLAL